jgi:hypothetical protein
MNWQPIETAPKGNALEVPRRSDQQAIDSPDILLLSRDGIFIGHYDFYYHPGFGHGASDNEPPWRTNVESQPIFNPTHWMPLPAPSIDDGEPCGAGVPDKVKEFTLKPVQKLQWTDNTVPDKAGLWAFMSPRDSTVFYKPVSDIGAQHPERWDTGRWCLVGPVPVILLPPASE